MSKHISNKKIAYTILLSFLFVALLYPANAQLSSAFPTPFGEGGRLNLGAIVSFVFNIVLYAALLWAIWHIVLAGFTITKAKDNAEERKKGIDAIINAVIGLVVALLAFVIVSVVTNFLGVSTSQLEISSVPCTGRTSDGEVFPGFHPQNGDMINYQECATKDGKKTGNVVRSTP
ncbi:MAG: pilin [Candidatus Dojkabacteria bacterium]|nr:pilin [Candidatus Dojkabacteria bacterium]